MAVLLIGLNHETAGVGLRECVSIDASDLPRELEAARDRAGLDEVVILSTCNRTEVYAELRSGTLTAVERVVERLAAMAGMEPHALLPHVYVRKEAEAVGHLFRVAAGLDSLVLGEPQILGQVRGAWESAKSAGTCGRVLGRLFQAAAQVGKSVRSRTALGATPVSVATISVQLAERLFGDLGARAVMVVGAGEMSETVACMAADRGARDITFANRTLARAEALSSRFGGRAVPLAELAVELERADVVLTGTGSDEPIMSRALLDGVMRRRRGRQLLVVDMAVPRDVEPSAARLNNLYLFDIDALEEIAAEHRRQREAEVPRAEEIVASARVAFMRWKESQTVVPTIVELRKRLEDIGAAEAQATIGKIPDLDERSRRRIQRMSHAIVAKILHEPQSRLRAAASAPAGTALTDSIRYLFGLDEGDGS